MPTNREPTHPGEVLREDFLNAMGVTQKELAESIHVPFQRVNEIVRGRRSMSPSTALRLARFFGTSAGFWMNLQLRYDLYGTERSEKEALEEIEPFHRPRRLGTVGAGRQ